MKKFLGESGESGESGEAFSKKLFFKNFDSPKHFFKKKLKKCSEESEFLKKFLGMSNFFRKL